MAKTSPQLAWCIVRLGEDVNWWVQEISDEVHWDVDGLSIIDPRQLAHIIELLEPLHDYGFEPDIMEAAFYSFRISNDLGGGRVKLTRTNDSILESEDKLFALPDILDDETGPYADFIDHITKLRVKMLNDSMNFEKKLTVDELEEEIRDEENNSFLEGRSVHLFNEITAILEYVPAGFELDSDDDDDDEETEEVEDEVAEAFPDLEEHEGESLQEDETMRWDEDDEDEEDEEEDEDLDGDDDDDEEEDEEAPRRGRKRG